MSEVTDGDADYGGVGAEGDGAGVILRVGAQVGGAVQEPEPADGDLLAEAGDHHLAVQGRIGRARGECRCASSRAHSVAATSATPIDRSGRACHV